VDLPFFYLDGDGMTSKQEGFTLIELLIVVAIIAIIAAIGVPGLLRARQSGNEASAIGSIRAINSAEATYAASCGGGGFAQSLTDLGLAPSGGVPFINADLVVGVRSGYTFGVADRPGSIDVLPPASTCNGSAAASRSGFYVHAEPVQAGRTGQRSFASDNTEALYWKADGSAVPSDMSGARLLQ
jgi:type IV pilus assembly protein PilA